MSSKPEVKRERHEIITINHDITVGDHKAALIEWLKKKHRDFRGFPDNRLNFIFHASGVVTLTGSHRKSILVQGSQPVTLPNGSAEPDLDSRIKALHEQQSVINNE